MFASGLIVSSIAGHDKDSFFCIVGAEREYVFLADGKLRKIDKPKRKNVKHIRATTTILDPEALTTDKKLRRALAAYAGGGGRKEGGN